MRALLADDEPAVRAERHPVRHVGVVDDGGDGAARDVEPADRDAMGADGGEAERVLVRQVDRPFVGVGLGDELEAAGRRGTRVRPGRKGSSPDGRHAGSDTDGADSLQIAVWNENRELFRCRATATG